MNGLHLTPFPAERHDELMDLAKAEARRLRQEAVREFDYGAGSLARSARRLQAALKRHAALRGLPQGPSVTASAR